MTSHRLAELTGPAARAALVGRPVILLPLGSHEDHGPGAPMGDYVLAEAIADRIAARAGAEGTPCLVAPALPFGGADWFGSVPGGIALSPATIRAVIVDMIGCLLRHGQDRLMIVNGHGGNAAPVAEATLAVRREHGVVIPSLYLWKIATGWLEPGQAGHGGDPVVSIARHLFPELCPEATAPPRAAADILGMRVTGFGTAELDGAPIDVPVELDQIGLTGDPATASAARGAILTERLVALGASLAARIAR